MPSAPSRNTQRQPAQIAPERGFVPTEEELIALIELCRQEALRLDRILTAHPDRINRLNPAQASLVHKMIAHAKD